MSESVYEDDNIPWSSERIIVFNGWVWEENLPYSKRKETCRLEKYFAEDVVEVILDRDSGKMKFQLNGFQIGNSYLDSKLRFAKVFAYMEMEGLRLSVS